MIRAVLLALWALSATASAQDDVPPLAPFSRITVKDSDVCIGWQRRDFTYTADAAGSARTPGETEFDAIDASFRTWQVASDLCSDFQFIRGERKQDTVFGYDRDSTENDNIIVFREENCRDVVPPDDPCLADGSCANAYDCWNLSDYAIAITVTSFSSATGAIFDADIALNAGMTLEGTRLLFTAVDQPVCELVEEPTCVSTDVQNTVTHEIGHVLGLDHVSTPGSTMQLSAPLGETHKRVIDSGTREGLCFVHPAGMPFTDCRDPDASLSIRGVNSGTSLFTCAGAPAGPFALGALWLALRRRRLRFSRRTSGRSATGA